MRLKKILSLLLAMTMLFSCVGITAFAEETPTTVTTAEELSAAIANGGKVVLGNDITTTSAIVTSGVTAEIDLNGNTLKIGAGDNKFNDESNITIKNGNINIDGANVSGNAIFCIDEYEKTLVTTLTLEDVNLTGDGYDSAYGVFYIGSSSVLNVIGGVWNLSNDTHASGGVFKADDSNATLNITGAEMTLHNVRRVVTYAATEVKDSTITVTGDADGVDAEMEHGFNRSPLVIDNSTITMTDMVGRGITAQNGAVEIKNGSKVTITNAQEATIDVRNGQTVAVSDDSTVKVDKEPTISSGTISGSVITPPKSGTIMGYTSETTIWGETWANARESYVIKVYSDDTFMGQSKLNPDLFTMNGNVNVTWSIALDAESNTDEYWIMSWNVAPSLEMQPTHVAIEVDGVETSRGEVRLNSPDDLKPIYAAIADEDGKITSYATSLEKAAAVAEAGDTVLLLHDSNDSVEFVAGVTVDKNGFTADGVTVAEPVAVVEINGTEYTTLEEAVEAAKAGDTITLLSDVTLAEETALPAGITLNGNGFNINGSVYADGDLKIEGYTKVTGFSAGFYNHTITIGEGACLEVTGTGRVTLGYGNVFNITGTIEDAKSADKAAIQPSLIIPGGISITGGNDAEMNVTNAYVKLYNTSSKNSVANGAFEINFDNSIAEFTHQLTFSEPTSGKKPTFKVNVKDSVLTTATKLCIAAPNTEFAVDNSIVTLGSYLRNSGKLTIKNGSKFTGSMIQFGESGGNNGSIVVDGSEFTINNNNKAYAMDGKGAGSLILKNGSVATIDYIKDSFYSVDKTSTLNIKELINCEKVSVAKIGDTYYETLEEALKALKSGDTLTLLADVTITDEWDCRYTGGKITVPVTIDGNGHIMTFTNTVYDGGNYMSVFRFESDATVKNLTIDMKNAVSGFQGRFRAISAKGDLTVDNCTFIGNGSENNTRAIIFGEGAGAAISDVEVSVTNSTFTGWRRGVSDNENAQDVATVKIEGNTFNDANVYVSANTSVVFNNNNMTAGWANIQSYAKENSILSIVAQGNTLTENTASNYNVINYFATKNVQEGFIIPAKTYKVATKTELDAAIAKAADGDIILLTADIDYAGTASLEINKAITLDLGGKTLTTYGTYGGLRLMGDCSIKNGTLAHKGTVTAIKAWNVKAIEDLVITVAERPGKTVGGIVIQENAAGIKTIKNVTIKGEGLTNGIETYNCGNATSPVIGSMENVTIDAKSTGMLISAPCGTATNCNIKGGTTGIELWIKGTYSASLDLKGCTVDGDEQALFIHDEFTSNAGAVNNGTLELTADDETTFENEKLVMTIARAENLAIDDDILKMRSLQGAGTAEKPYIINNLNDLKWFRDDVNAGNTYNGKYVKLAADIDLKDETWTPIAKFEGVFDGDNKTISNLVVNGGRNKDQGFFAVTMGGEIKNITFNNAKVTGRLDVGVVAGTPYTSKYTNIKVTGHVEVNGMAYVGGVGGKNAYADWTDITVDVDESSYVKAISTENGSAYRTYVGGVIGFMGEGSHTVKNVTSNINVIGDVCDIGGIVGIAHYGNNFENVKCTANVTNTNTDAAKSAQTGGIAGVWHNEKGYTVTFTNCNFTGKVTATGVAENEAVGAAYNASNNTEENSGSLVIDGETAWPKLVYVAQIGENKYTSLQEALDAAAAGTGNITVDILADIDLTDVDWNPVTVSGPGYPVVTVNGNGKTITGLNDMLFAGTWAGGSGLIINDLTIKDSTIENDVDDTTEKTGVGAFIGFPQASSTITLKNCHLVNSTVEGGHWTGGLIGYAAGYAGNDGPVFMNLTITGCSVTGSTVTGKGSAGGVIGHGSGNGWTNVVIENTTVSNNTITSTGSSTNKAGALMGTIGAAGQSTTVNGVTKTGGASVSATVSGNIVKSNGTPITTIYGRQGTNTGMLYVTGGTYDNYPIEKNVAYAQPKEGYKIVQNNDGTYGVKKLFEFYKMNLDLESSMKVNFYISADYFVDANYYAEIVHSSATGENKCRVDFADWKDNNSYKQISYTELVAKNMADRMTITIYDENGKQVSVAQEASIKTYAETYIKENAGTEDKWVTSLVDMLNYGAEAQKFFDYNEENLANADIGDYQQYATKQDVELENIAEVSEHVYQANLDLENRIVYNGYFENVTSDMTAEVSYTNHVGKLVTDSVSIVKSGSYYKVAVNTLVIADANQLITITIKDSNGEEYAYIKDTVNSYLYRAIKAESEPKKFEPLAKAMAKFTASAYTALHKK